jgi:hypothetical protein
MVLYDYARVTTRQWGLSERDKEHGEYARPAVFIVGTDHKVVHAWTDQRPAVDEIMAKITEITGLPKPEEEAEEEPQEAGEKPKKMSAEERERIKAERRAAREAGKKLKKPTAQREQSAGADTKAEEEETAQSMEATEPPEAEPEGAEESARDKAQEG